MGYSNSSILTSTVGRHDIPVLDRFFAKVKIQENGCWLWTGGTTLPPPNGYGRLRVNGVKTVAHKFSYETFIRKVPDKLKLDHWCRNRLCVNPFHVRPVTHALNIYLGTAPTVETSMLGQCKQGHELSWRIVNCKGKRFMQGWCKPCYKAGVRRRNGIL